MSCLLEHLLRNPELEREVRRSAAEIDASVVAPIRIDKPNPRHSRNSRGAFAPAGLKRPSSHASSEGGPARGGPRGFQPTAELNASKRDASPACSPGRH